MIIHLGTVYSQFATSLRIAEHRRDAPAVCGNEVPMDYGPFMSLPDNGIPLAVMCIYHTTCNKGVEGFTDTLF